MGRRPQVRQILADVERSAASTADRVADRAVQFYEGDVAAIVALHPTVVGTLVVSGNGRADFSDCGKKAADEAAKRGGTHFVMMSEDVRRLISSIPGYSYPQSSAAAGAVAIPRYAAAGARAQSSNVSVGPQIYTSEAQAAQYRILRIEPDRWRESPEALRPQAK